MRAHTIREKKFDVTRRDERYALDDQQQRQFACHAAGRAGPIQDPGETPAHHNGNDSQNSDGVYLNHRPILPHQIVEITIVLAVSPRAGSALSRILFDEFNDHARYVFAGCILNTFEPWTGIHFHDDRPA